MVWLLATEARQAVFTPLDDGAQRSASVVRRLGSAIALGLIEDGEQLPAEHELALSLGVSTTTLREALADLRRRGLVETRRGRGGGSFVRATDDALAALSTSRIEELGTTDLRDLGEFHAAISGAASLHAAERSTEQEADRLDDLVERLAAASDVTDRRRIDGRFYIELAASAQSVRFTLQAIELQTELGQLPWPPSDAYFADTVQSHRAIVAAVRERDAERARRLTEEHILTRTQWLIDLHMQAVAGEESFA